MPGGLRSESVRDSTDRTLTDSIRQIHRAQPRCVWRPEDMRGIDEPRDSITGDTRLRG